MRFLRLNLRRQRTQRPGRRTGPADRRKNVAHAAAIPTAEERRRGEDDRRNGPRSRLVSSSRMQIDTATPPSPRSDDADQRAQLTRLHQRCNGLFRSRINPAPRAALS